jgi:hypothetical protein
MCRPSKPRRCTLQRSGCSCSSIPHRSLGISFLGMCNTSSMSHQARKSFCGSRRHDCVDGFVEGPGSTSGSTRKPTGAAPNDVGGEPAWRGFFRMALRISLSAAEATCGRGRPRPPSQANMEFVLVPGPLLATRKHKYFPVSELKFISFMHVFVVVTDSSADSEPRRLCGC